MTFNTFNQLIQRLQQISETEHTLYKLNVDILEFTDSYHEIITTLIREVYGETGEDWWSWFCYENDFGTGKLTAHDENKNPICYDIKSLWEFLETNHSKINSDKNV